MVSFLGLLVLATSVVAYATPLAVRDAGTDLLVTDLLRLDQTIRNIAYAAGNYTGETIAESNRIIAVVANPIAPDITDAVNALIAKKALIASAGLSAETAAGLNLISCDHDTLSLVAVAPKLNAATISAAAAPVLRIDVDWRRGVAAFGGIPLAPITM
ncbi:hypothetical protein LTR53_012906 [Teratosphaeriaceae sp. CCFEE 6253]|nr:hypothetical protein LTR53_012906 [Teratosphaeriaceae sp. CCFEE 6253]